MNGGRLAFEAAGDGAGVVFLHPGLWDMRTWDPQFGVFSRTYRAVRYDARGYGRSSRLEPGRPYSNVEDLVAVLDAAGLERAALVGCSMGGGIALDAALAIPDRVSALVLAASAVGGFEELTVEELAEWEALDGPVEEALDAGDLERAEDLRLRIWAPLGTDDESGQRIRQIAFDNLHELTMDESGAASARPTRDRAARGGRGAHPDPARRPRPAVPPARQPPPRGAHPGCAVDRHRARRSRDEPAGAGGVRPGGALVPGRGPGVRRRATSCALPPEPSAPRR